MKYLLLIYLILSCARFNKNTVNYHSENIFDLSVTEGHIIYYCTEPTDTLEPRSFLSIYLFRPGRTDLFFTRRKLQANECLDWIKEIDRIYSKNKPFRIVGIEGNENPRMDDELPDYYGVKEPFRIESSWYFSRLITGKGCMGHFGGECVDGYSEKKRFINP